MKVQKTNLGTQIIAYADDERLIGDDIRTIERNADLSLNACKDIDLTINTDIKTKYMEVGRYRDVTANELVMVGSNSYEKVNNR